MPGRNGGTVHARIVYWGVAQAGVSTSLRLISTRLHPGHRGELQQIPTRLDPTVDYEVLPIKLGEIGGVDTRFEIVAAPGDPEQAPTRKQLLDRADGIVFVADARRERLAACVERFEELRRTLAAYGRSLESVPFVVQLNRSDESDAASREELVRKLDVPRSVVFEASAAAGQGVLQALSTISKAVVRSLRERRAGAGPGSAAAELRRPAPHGNPPGAPRSAPPKAPGSAPPETLRSGPPEALRSAPPETLRSGPPEALRSTPPLPPPAPPREAPRPPAAPAPEPKPARPAPPAPLVSVHEDVTGRIDAPPPGAPRGRAAATLRIVSVGEPVVQLDGAVRLPLDLCDEEGRRFHLSLTLSLGPAAGGNGR